MIVDKQAEKLKQVKQMEQRAAEDGGAPEGDDASGDRPCSVYALGAACSGGFLGATYGFGKRLRRLLYTGLHWLASIDVLTSCPLL